MKIWKPIHCHDSAWVFNSFHHWYALNFECYYFIQCISGNLELSSKCFQELVLKDQNHPAALINYAAFLLCKYGSIVAGILFLCSVLSPGILLICYQLCLLHKFSTWLIWFSLCRMLLHLVIVWTSLKSAHHHGYLSLNSQVPEQMLEMVLPWIRFQLSMLQRNVC